MAHEVESMMYYGDAPWHRLGNEVMNVATAEEAIVAAQLDRPVELVDAYQRIDGKFVKVEGYQWLRRADDHRVYNSVGKIYRPIQNRECFDFFDAVVGTKEAKYHTAGSLKHGARIWLLAKLNDSFYPAGSEKQQTDRYLLLINSHDGSSALQMFWTKIRVVCNNTLEMAISSILGERFYSRHTAGYKEKIDQAKELLGLVHKHDETWKAQAEHLATLQLPEAKVPLLLAAAFGTSGAMKPEDIYKPTLRDMEKAKELIYAGRGQDDPAIQGTAWQAYNGVVEYVDYYRKPRSKEEDARLSMVWFGAGAGIKKRAWNYLMKQS